MDNTLIEKLKALKANLKEDNFILMGVFGSFARGEERPNSDVDLLYKIDDIESYLKKHSGWDSINHIVQTKQIIEKHLNKKVDFVDIECLNEIGKEHILKDLIYV